MHCGCKSSGGHPGGGETYSGNYAPVTGTEQTAATTEAAPSGETMTINTGAQPPPTTTEQTGAVGEIPSSQIPAFPWPPPQASATAKLLPDFFTNAQTLGGVDKKLSGALGSCKYAQWSYYSVPGGFALITQMEQIEANGKPKKPRWMTTPNSSVRFSLNDYLRALLSAPLGRFRIIAFIVTKYPFSQTNVPVTRNEAMAWLPNGTNILPPPIAGQPYTAGHTCSALIYEFEVSGTNTAVLDMPSPISGKAHLTAAHLAPAKSLE